ncbi:MAG: cache and HAMP domain-containing protein [Candidatus Aminicenantes bacterium]|nr:cache and HAMP domain-containing protein [Candidatus Aminicenantes bacterium]
MNNGKKEDEKIKWHEKLYTRMALVTIAAVVIPALIIGFIAISKSRDALFSRVEAAQSETVKTLKNQVESFLSGARGDVLFLSRSPLFRALLRAGSAAGNKNLAQLRRQVGEEFLAFSENRGFYYQVRYIDEKGMEIVRVDNDGKNSYIVPHDRLQDKSGRGYFREASVKENGALYVSALDLNREQGQVEVPYKPVIRYATPVFYPGNEKKRGGIVITNIYARFFLEPLWNAGETDIYMVKNDGSFAAHPDKEKMWGSPEDLSHGAGLNKEFPLLAEEAAAAAGGQLRAGKNYFTFQHIIQAGTPIKWLLAGGQPLAEIMSVVNKFTMIFAGITAVLVLLFIFAAMWFASTITRPVERLTGVADKVSMGDLDVQVESKSKGEIGKLEGAVERMRISMVLAMKRMKKMSAKK